MHLFNPVPFGETKRLSPELAFRFVHAGHILGSGMVELFIGGEGRPESFSLPATLAAFPCSQTRPAAWCTPVLKEMKILKSW